jgi:GrpB-like predicted nucleotidyltransferase (UPF0157 family)
VTPGRQDPIRILPYDDSWPLSFETQRIRVEQALSPWLAHPVEHIGSTAVPGLPAKPIIDMLALVPDHDTSAGVVEAMTAAGWHHADEPHDRERRRRSFCHPTVAWRTHHLHVWEITAPWRPLLAFRNHLRTHPADASRYAALKSALAAADPGDRPAYRSGKSALIEEILRTAVASPE